MNILTATVVLLCTAGLAACASPASDLEGDSVLASQGAVFEDRGETFTGSRIPQKSTTHVLKRVGNADYKKAKADANSGNVKPGAWGK